MKTIDRTDSLRCRPAALLATLALASACTTTGGGTGMPTDAKKDVVDKIPLLVHLDGGCTVSFIQTVASCEGVVLPPTVPAGQDLACREKGKWISWFAVTGSSWPYKPAPGSVEFEIAFGAGKPDPVEKDKGRGTKCKQSRDGVLSCNVKSSVDAGEYKYSIKIGSCVLDPRLYVH